MKRLTITGLALLLAACAKPMTNDEIIAEVKKCEAAGMRPDIFYGNLFDMYIVKVQCVPRGGSK